MWKDADRWIQTLGLSPHPEGGHFRETWRSRRRTEDGRALGSAIYFLLEGDDFSAFHRLTCDEMWHLYAGGPVTITMISPGGSLSRARLGTDVEKGEAPQVLVPSGVWFAASLESEGGALVGCTTSPGFRYADWELAERHALISEFPDHRAVIEALTRPAP